MAASTESDSRARIAVLRKILEDGEAGTQEELRDALAKEGFDVTQSTVSRSLRKLAAVKILDEQGRTVYRLPEELQAPPAETALGDLITDIADNGYMIVIHTSPGSASLVARHLDHYRPGGLLGTIAGDDTIFVAPASTRELKKTIEAIKATLL